MIKKIWEFILGFIGLFFSRPPVIGTEPVVVETWIESTGSAVYFFKKYSDGTIQKEPWHGYDDDDPTGVDDFLDSLDK